MNAVFIIIQSTSYSFNFVNESCRRFKLLPSVSTAERCCGPAGEAVRKPTDKVFRVNCPSVLGQEQAGFEMQL